MFRSSLVLAAFVAISPAAASAAEFVWAVGEAKASRWVEAGTTEVGAVKTDQKLEVLYREGARLRVRLSGGKFGWLDESAVTTVQPIGAAATEPSFDLSKLNLGGAGGGGLKLDADGNLVLQ